MSWQTYNESLQKRIALQQCMPTEIEYGEIIYQSPQIQDMRWIVAAFEGEYNVFVDHIAPNGSCDRSLGASFCWKSAALEFALRMFLVCSGKLCRKEFKGLSCE